MKTALLAAIADNGVIGVENRMPWHLPADMRRFRELTMDNTVIMGRNTYESIGRPLPDRENYILTRREGFTAEGCHVATSLWEALALAPANRTRFIIGGTEIYKEALNEEIVDMLYITRVHTDAPGNVYFPDYDASRWKLVWSEHHPKDDKNPLPHTYEIYVRKD
jgi:dihydrofolate reductase